LHVCCVTTSPNCNSGGADWTFPHGLFDKKFSQSSETSEEKLTATRCCLFLLPSKS
jgi:hypothetical protein